MATGESAVKTFLKRSPWIHASYKFSKIAGQAPLADWLLWHRTLAILRVLPNTMLPAPRLIQAYEAVVSLEREGVPGDVAECGVWSGGGIGLMALAAMQFPASSRRFHLFDSFEGLPQPSPEDVDVLDDYLRSHPDGRTRPAGGDDPLIAIGACVGASAPVVAEFLHDRLGIDPERVVFHVGWFQETVPRARRDIRELGILRIDGDWYDSTKTCLEGLFDRVVAGGFVIIDDYGTFAGCHKAVDEFLTNAGISASRLIPVDDDCVFFRK